MVNNEITKTDAEILLNLSRKQINRLIKIFKEQGEAGFIHKSRGKEKQNKIDDDLLTEIKELYLTKYYDYNFIAFYEEIEEKYKRSYPVIYKAFMDDDIISPYCS